MGAAQVELVAKQVPGTNELVLALAGLEDAAALLAPARLPLLVALQRGVGGHRACNSRGLQRLQHFAAVELLRRDGQMRRKPHDGEAHYFISGLENTAPRRQPQ